MPSTSTQPAPEDVNQEELDLDVDVGALLDRMASGKYGTNQEDIAEYFGDDDFIELS